jgi:hypothetical protein
VMPAWTSIQYADNLLEPESSIKKPSKKGACVTADGGALAASAIFSYLSRYQFAVRLFETGQVAQGDRSSGSERRDHRPKLSLRFVGTSSKVLTLSGSIRGRRDSRPYSSWEDVVERMSQSELRLKRRLQIDRAQDQAYAGVDLRRWQGGRCRSA